MTPLDEGYDDQLSYRPVSTPAVLALVGGGLSALALTSQVLWVVPLLAAGLAAVALRDTATGTPPKAGRALALSGLALAVGFGCQAIGFTVTDHWIGRARAIETASSWQQAVHAGRWAEAHDFCAPAALPAADDPFAEGGREPHNHADEHAHDAAERQDDSLALKAFRELPSVMVVEGCREVVVAGCRRDDAYAAGSWRVTLALSDCDGAAVTGRPQQVELMVRPETIRVPLLTPGATGTQLVERWRIIRFDPDE
ncbi:MAG: hypothetical protein RLZZ622_1730 [Planctomycetota bacterium]|jgi:hypothetical protein